MDKKPLVSILSSVYNERPYIEQTIRSVLKQTYEHWEWIIVDDGSTDGTGEILRGIKNERVKYVYQERSGSVARNMNRALGMSRGEIVAAIDGDDLWPDNKCELQVKSFDDQGVVLSYGECAVINGDGRRIGYIGLPEDLRVACNEPRGISLRRLLIDVDCFICNATVMYRRSSLSVIGGFVERNCLAQDFSTWIRLSLVGKFSPVPSCLGYYRKHLESWSFTVNQVSHFERQIDFLREFFLQNLQALYECGIEIDIDALEDRWLKGKRKAHILNWLNGISLFIGADMVSPLVFFVNRNRYVKKIIQRFLYL